MSAPQVFHLPAHSVIPEPDLLFHPDRPQEHSQHPLQGLVKFGPYSRSLVGGVLDPIRLATIAPFGYAKRVEALVAELESKAAPKERKQYLIDFPGFSRVFGLRALLGPAATRIEMDKDLGTKMVAAEKPHLILADQLTRAVASLEAHRSEFDVLIILLPSAWEKGFFGGADEDFDLHDYLKAVTAARAIPTQLLREDRALSYFCRCSVMWRLGIALYTKAGGVPWKLSQTDPEAAFIGLSYALKTSGDKTRFVTCCSQVFDSDGTGLEFIAYDTAAAHVERDNPFLSRAEMRRVMVRSLDLYQRRHAGRVPKRVVIHKSSPFKPDEVDGCFDAWRASDGLELIQVQQDSLWRGIKIGQPKGGGSKGQAARYPCDRGSILQIGPREALFWTQGNAPTSVGGQDFFKEGKGIPSPLLLSRYAGHGSWHESCRDILGLTKMDWNNDALYDRLPVTMGYARVLARTIKRMPSLAPRPYQFRFFM